jgi:hypothetical protein
MKLIVRIRNNEILGFSYPNTVLTSKHAIWLIFEIIPGIMDKRLFSQREKTERKVI